MTAWGENLRPDIVHSSSVCDSGGLKKGSASGSLLAAHILILGGFIMILGGFLRAERFLELSLINVASILVEQSEQPGILA